MSFRRSLRSIIALVLFLPIVCFGQGPKSKTSDQKTFPNFDEYRRRALRESPSDISLHTRFKGNRTIYKFGELVKIILTFSTRNYGAYSIEQDLSNNPAGDLFVFRRADNTALQMHGRNGYVCCGSHREYLREKPISTISDYQTYRGGSTGGIIGGIIDTNDPKLRAFLEQRRREREIEAWGVNLPPGEYDFFVRTYRVSKGWPEDLYANDNSPLVVTSRNVLHITILPRN